MHKVLLPTVTLTFYLVTWLLFATHCLVMMIICAKLFSNPIMHNTLMGRTRTGFTGLCTKFKCDLDLWPGDKLSCHNDYLCQIIVKSHYLRLSYCSDTILDNKQTHTHTDRVNSICFPPFHGGGIIKLMSDTEASVLDLHLSISDGFVKTKFLLNGMTLILIL